jgi:uncharacterized protein (TIGR00369 family)
MRTSLVPEAFGQRFDGLEEQFFRAFSDNVFHHCFGCGPEHPTGLRVRVFKENGGIVSPIIVPKIYEGPPGAAHGGIVAAYLDEVLAASCLAASGRVAVTGELTVRYVRPVPSETALLGRARGVDSGRHADAEGALEVFATGEVVATARGRFVHVRPRAAAGG